MKNYWNWSSMYCLIFWDGRDDWIYFHFIFFLKMCFIFNAQDHYHMNPCSLLTYCLDWRHALYLYPYFKYWGYPCCSPHMLSSSACSLSLSFILIFCWAMTVSIQIEFLQKTKCFFSDRFINVDNWQ